jgi:hypothetical protein
MPLYSFKTVTSLFSSTTSAANVSTGETDLITYSMPGSTLAVNGQKVRVTAFGDDVNNANLKSIRIYFGATVIGAITGQTTPTGWLASGIVIRTGAATQVAFGGVTMHTGTQTETSSAPAETLSNAITIKVTGQSGTASGDVTAKGLIVELIPA